MSDFATRYVSLIQIWKTEYTRTQLPGPPEEPVSPGRDRTEREGNVTGSRMGYIHIGILFKATKGYGESDSSEKVRLDCDRTKGNDVFQKKPIAS